MLTRLFQARNAKEATGRAMFESGKWRTDADDADESSDEEEEDTAAWNLEKLRQETEALRAKKEEERLAKEGHPPVSNGIAPGLEDAEPSADAAGDGEAGPSNSG